MFYFSWEEIGLFDVSANIDYILQTTNFPKLYLIGYSQGSTEILPLLSLRPDYNDKLKFAMLLAPSVFLTNIRHWLFSPLAQRYQEFQQMIDSNHLYRLSDLAQSVISFQKVFCTDPRIRPACLNLFSNTLGLRSDNVEALNLLMSKYPDGTAVMQMLHYAQLIVSGKFRRYDFGPQKNLVRYGSNDPPSYDLGKVTAPVYIVVLVNDVAVPIDVRNVKRIKLKISNNKIST